MPAAASGLWTLVRMYPRETCRVADALCAEHRTPQVERVLTVPMPPDLLPNQWPAKKGCPRPYRQVGKHPGCWLRSDETPPCGAAYEAEGRCWGAYTPTSPRPSVEDPRRERPW